MRSTVAIKAEGLVKKYSGVAAVDGISLTVNKGEIFGFLGPNGAGKTTTINMLCTLATATSGRASINGYDCATEPQEVRRSIGLVFQDTTLDKDLTARENLVFHAYLYSVKKSEIKERVDDALHFVDLFDRSNDLVKKFSGGMKRRLEIARGLIHRPSVLFLDEPTIGLDPQSRANLWDFITKLPERHGMTIFMTTHYMDEAEVCDKIAIIDKGKIIASGSPDELKSLTGGDVIHIKTPDDEQAAFKLEQNLSLKPVRKDGGLAIAAEHGEEHIPQIIKALGGEVLSIKLERPSLNDVFLKLTGKAIRDESVEAGGLSSDLKAYRRRHR
jgi:ABC-2 type transport system ATP-binding protein